MSELLPGVYLVDDVALPGRPGTVNVSLLVSGDGTATLVDAGFPGIAEKLSATLDEAGLTPAAVRRVIITHHHSDHTGGLPEVVAMTGAEVWAHNDDAGIIDGTSPRPAPPSRPSGAANAPSSMHRFAPAPVDLRLVGGETLAVLGGCRILHTPGHTHGHLSLYLAELSLLIAGDILRYENGVVTRAPAQYTNDAESNERSLAKVAAIGFTRMLPYHGEFLGADACVRMRSDLGLG
jgi:glyoxylase-like metal-dependent hydrolase (beta-lactamase superfamily II)